MNWRDKIDPTLKSHLEALIKETAKEKSALRESKDPKISQLWIAIASLSKRNFDLQLKIKYVESALKDFLKAKKQIKTSKKEQEQINNILKSLSKF